MCPWDGKRRKQRFILELFHPRVHICRGEDCEVRCGERVDASESEFGILAEWLHARGLRRWHRSLNLVLLAIYVKKPADSFLVRVYVRADLGVDCLERADMDINILVLKRL